MSKVSRDLIKSLTPENRNIVLLLQMRMGQYLDGEITLCKRVNVIRQNGREFICPVGNPSIERLSLRPIGLNVHGDLVASVTPLQGGCDLIGTLDIMVGAEELAASMRTVSALKNKPAALKGVDVAVLGNEMLSSEPDVRINPDIVITQASIERRLVGPWDGPGWDKGMDEETRYNRIRLAEMAMDVPAGVGRVSPVRIHGETEFNDRYGTGPVQVSPEALAIIEDNCNQESRSASRALIMNKAPLSESEYFNRKMQIPGYEPIKHSFWARMGYKWEMFRERVTESRVVRFFKSLFNR